jgi:hypothetical protein
MVGRMVMTIDRRGRHRGTRLARGTGNFATSEICCLCRYLAE